MWDREGEGTTWLHWIFDSVKNMPPVSPTRPDRYYPLPFYNPSARGMGIYDP